MKKSSWQGWVQVKWKPGTPDSAWKDWTKNKWVKGVWSTQGNWDCTIWLDVKSQDEFEEFVWKNIRSNKWVENTESFWAKQWWSKAAA